MQLLHSVPPLASGSHAMFWPTSYLPAELQVKKGLDQTVTTLFITQGVTTPNLFP